MGEATLFFFGLFLGFCAKRWQTREGTYQLKRRRLKLDVKDSPEYPGADIDMADI